MSFKSEIGRWVKTNNRWLTECNGPELYGIIEDITEYFKVWSTWGRIDKKPTWIHSRYLKFVETTTLENNLNRIKKSKIVDFWNKTEKK